MKQLRGNQINPSLGILPATAEVSVGVYPMDFEMKLFTKADGSGGLSINYSEESKVITIDRSGMAKQFNTNIGMTRFHKLENGLSSLRIFIDNSSVEIFVNDGDAVFTSRVFPEENEHSFIISECTSINIWEMRSSVSDDFVV